MMDPLSLVSERLNRSIARLPRHWGDFKSADIPTNGVYFFFEQGEIIERDGERIDRIVRVGTHRRDGNLPVRLKHHYRSNIRGSVFRRHCRSALCERRLLSDSLIAQIGMNPAARIPEVEAVLSTHFVEHFSFACVPIASEGDRLRLEAGLIALFANWPIGKPSESWLGRSASREEIRLSGLWNTQHVHGAPVTTPDIALLIDLIAEQPMGF